MPSMAARNRSSSPITVMKSLAVREGQTRIRTTPIKIPRICIGLRRRSVQLARELLSDVSRPSPSFGARALRNCRRASAAQPASATATWIARRYNPSRTRISTTKRIERFGQTSRAMPTTASPTIRSANTCSRVHDRRSRLSSVRCVGGAWRGGGRLPETPFQQEDRRTRPAVHSEIGSF